jgi:hypothetical protein
LRTSDGFNEPGYSARQRGERFPQRVGFHGCILVSRVGRRDSFTGFGVLAGSANSAPSGPEEGPRKNIATTCATGY